jgi:hypothetical protein
MRLQKTTNTEPYPDKEVRQPAYHEIYFMRL